MPDIFISYARADRDRVEWIAAALEAEGYDVWWDRALEPGRSFRDDIDDNLAKAKCVLVVWSKTSVRRNFVVEEAQDGLDRAVLVPVMIDDAARDIPRGFKSLQAADLSRWRGDRDDPEWKRVLARVKRLVENPSKPPKPYNPPKRKSGVSPALGLAAFFAIIAAGIAFLYFTGRAPDDVAAAAGDPPPNVKMVKASDGSGREFGIAHERKTMYVRVRRVAVYKDPEATAEEIGVFEPNEAVSVTGRVNRGLDGQSWYQVVAPNGRSGYVLLTTLRDETPEDERRDEGGEPIDFIIREDGFEQIAVGGGFPEVTVCEGELVTVYNANDVAIELYWVPLNSDAFGLVGVIGARSQESYVFPVGRWSLYIHDHFENRARVYVKDDC